MNSPVRAFSGVGGTPRFIARAKGARLVDVDGNSFVDYVGSWGPAILGHANAEVIREVDDQLRDGSSFGAPSPREIVARRDGAAAVPLDRAHALRLVRDRGHHRRHPARARLHRPRRPAQVRRLLPRRRGRLARQGRLRGGDARPARLAGRARRRWRGTPSRCPTTTSPRPRPCSSSAAGPSPPSSSSRWSGTWACSSRGSATSPGLQAACRKHGALLIVDEVMTGFRLAPGGACGALRAPSRPRHLRQGDRRRAAGGRLRGARRT